MNQCWQQVWPEVRAEAAQGVNVSSGLVLMRRLMELMRQDCAAGFRAWLEQADCWDDTLERDGRRLRFKLASVKEFATPEVRELAAFLLGLVTPEEAEQVLGKPAGRTHMKSRIE